jgi:hypothetical protein
MNNSNKPVDHISASLCDDSLLADALRAFLSHPAVRDLLSTPESSCLSTVTRAFNRTVRSEEEQTLVDAVTGHVGDNLDLDSKVKSCIEGDRDRIPDAVKEHFEDEPRWFSRLVEAEIENRIDTHAIANRMMNNILDEPDQFFSDLFQNASPELLDKLAATLASRLRIVHPNASITPFHSR